MRILGLSYIKHFMGLLREVYLMLKPNPVTHLASAILLISFPPLFPPLINSLLLNNSQNRVTTQFKEPEELLIKGDPNDQFTKRKISESPPCSLEFDPGNRTTKLSSLQNYNCAETLLALGFKLDLNHATRVDLELIPGISSKLSSAIVKKRDKILEGAKLKEPEQGYEALQLVKGIGENISLRLHEFIKFNGGSHKQQEPLK